MTRCRHCDSVGIDDFAHVYGERKCCPDCDHRVPDLSAAEAAKVAEFDAAPDAEESLRERVARAMYERTHQTGVWRLSSPGLTAVYRNEADAAIAVMRGDDA